MRKSKLHLPVLSDWISMFCIVFLISLSQIGFSQNDCTTAVSQNEDTKVEHQINDVEFWVKITPTDEDVYISLLESINGTPSTLDGFEVYEGNCSSLYSLGQADYEVGSAAILIEDLTPNNDYFVKVYQSATNNGYFNLYYGSTFLSHPTCPPTLCNLIPNGEFETLSPLAISTMNTQSVWVFTDETLPNDNICGWAKGPSFGNPWLWQDLAGNHFAQLIGQPWPSASHKLHNIINNGSGLNDGESYMFRCRYRLIMNGTLNFEVGLMANSNDYISSGRKTIFISNFQNATLNVWTDVETVFSINTYFSTHEFFYAYIVGQAQQTPIIQLDDFEIIPAMSSITPNQDICEGTEVQLEATVCLNDETYIPNYSWNSSPYDPSLYNHPQSGGNQTGNDRIYVFPSTNTTYTCTVSYSNGMFSTKSSVVTVHPTPDKPIITGNFHTCNYNTETYIIDNYNSNYTYQYEAVGYFGPDPVTGNSFDIDWTQFMPFNNGKAEIRVIATDIYSNCISESIFDVYDCCTNGSPIIWTDETLSYSPNISGQDVEINGILRIPQGFSLQIANSDIIMGGGARIIVEDDADIILDNVYMYSCDQLNMWDGIYLTSNGSVLSAINNSEFNDARNVIVADNGANFTITDCLFDKNIIGVIAKNYNQTYIAGISNSDFDMSTTNLLYPYDANTEIYGVKLFNITGNITIGENSKPNVENNFNYLDYGIFSDNSNFEAYNNIFFECATCIDAEGNTTKVDGGPATPREIIIGGNQTYGFNEFFGCYKGIKICRKANITIIDNKFDDCYWGIEIDDNNYTSIHLESNRIDNIAYKGISTNNTSSNIFMFDNHLITTTSANENFGIVCATNQHSQNPTYTAITRIYENNIYNAKRGIHIAGAEGLSVSSNDVKVYPNNISVPRFGIYIANISAPDIKYNDIMLYNATTQPVFGDVDFLQGIRLMNCNNGYIRKNNVFHMGSGIRMAANCLPTEISCNYLEDNYFGVQLENADIGNQGSANSPWDNEWDNTLINPNFLRIQGIYSGATSMQWFYQSPVQFTLFPNATYYSVTPILTFLTTQTGGGNYCSTVVPPIAPLAQNLQQNPSQFSAQIIKRDKQLGAILNGFYPNNTLTSNYATNAIFSDNQSFEKAKYFFKTILEKPAYMYLGTTADAKYQALMGIITASNIPYFYNANQFMQQHKDSMALSQLSQTTPLNIWENDLKTAMEMFVKHKSETLTKQDYLKLKTIAYKNAHDIGEAAFIARNLLGLCIVDNYIPVASYPKKKNNDKIPVIVQNVKVYPNPAKEQLTIEFTEPTDEFCQIIIVNMLGQKVLNRYFSNTQKVYINTTELESGVFFYKIINGNKTIKSDKLIIL